MKNLRFILAASLLGTACFVLPVRAQTFQSEYTNTTDFGYLYCLDDAVAGTYVYHLTWHVNPQTGFIDRIHWNIKEGTFVGVESGKVYRVHDTGNDSQGLNWSFFADVSSLPGELIPAQLPIEGSVVNMNFMFTSKGVVYHGYMLLQLHLNASGEPTADVVKYDLCF